MIFNLKQTYWSWHFTFNKLCTFTVISHYVFRANNVHHRRFYEIFDFGIQIDNFRTLLKQSCILSVCGNTAGSLSSRTYWRDSPWSVHYWRVVNSTRCRHRLCSTLHDCFSWNIWQSRIPFLQTITKFCHSTSYVCLRKIVISPSTTYFLITYDCFLLPHIFILTSIIPMY